MYKQVEATKNGNDWDIGYLISQDKKKYNVIPLYLFSDDATIDELMEDCSSFKEIIPLQYSIKTIARYATYKSGDGVEIYFEITTSKGNSLSKDYLDDDIIPNDISLTTICFVDISEDDKNSFIDMLNDKTIKNKEELFELYKTSAKSLQIKISSAFMGTFLLANYIQ